MSQVKNILGRLRKNCLKVINAKIEKPHKFVKPFTEIISILQQIISENFPADVVSDITHITGNITDFIETLTLYLEYIDEKDIKTFEEDFLKEGRPRIALLAQLLENKKSEYVEESDTVEYDFDRELAQIDLNFRNYQEAILDTNFLKDFEEQIHNPKQSHVELKKSIPIFAPQKVFIENKTKSGFGGPFAGKEILRKLIDKFFKIKPEDTISKRILNAWSRTRKGEQEIYSKGQDNAMNYFKNTAEFDIIYEVITKTNLTRKHFLILGQDKDIFETIYVYDRLYKQHVSQQFEQITIINKKLKRIA